MGGGVNRAPHPGSALWWMEASDDEAAARLAELRAADRQGAAYREAIRWVLGEETEPVGPALFPGLRPVRATP